MRPSVRAWRHSAATIFLAAAIVPAAAADKPCSAADKAVDGVTSWGALQKAVSDYGHCDKGPTAEVFTEAILRVVISGWPKVGDAGPLLDKDTAFHNWLMKRLASPAISTQDTAEIRDLAKSSCPKGSQKVCAELLSAVELSRAISAPELLQLTPAPATPPKAKP